MDGLVTNAAATGYVSTRTGTVDQQAYSGGGYWTHYGPTDWYIDAVLQGTHYTGTAKTEFASLPISGNGFIASLEGGYPIALAFGPQFVLEPQAQILWQKVSFSNALDGLGPVALGSSTGTTGRLGVRAKWTILTADGQVWQPYGRLNLWHDWNGRAATTFATTPVPLDAAATQLELAVGFTGKLKNRLSVYGQFGYQFDIAHSHAAIGGYLAMPGRAIRGERSKVISKHTRFERALLVERACIRFPGHLAWPGYSLKSSGTGSSSFSAIRRLFSSVR